MKTTQRTMILIIVLLSTMFLSAQIRFINKEYGMGSIALDPHASVKEKGIDIVNTITLVSYWKYISISVQSFTALDGGYLDIAGTFGTNITSGYFNQWRGYTGLRLGFINRGNYIYPLTGLEGGLQYNIGKIFIGGKGTVDYRSDYKFSGADAKWRESFYIEIGTKF